MKNLVLLLCAFALMLNTAYSIDRGDTSAIGWAALGEGVDDEVNAITIFNGNIVAGGSFTEAGGNSANFIAQWDGSLWSTFTTGLDGSVYSLAVYNNELYVGGAFTSAGGVSGTSFIAKWNGTSWSAVGTGVSDEVRALFVYNGELFAGGSFNSPGESIARWNGTSWSSLGTGVDDDVHAMTEFQGDLIAAGRFDLAGGLPASKIARWNGATWSALNSSVFDDRIFAVGVYNGILIAGGRFEGGSGVDANFLAQFNGTSWDRIGEGVEDEIHAITNYKGNLVVAGQHKFAYNTTDTIYCNRISYWDGVKWGRFSTGMGDKVSSLSSYIDSGDTVLIAGGEFDYAGGRTAGNIAIWQDNITYSIQGVVRYASNNQPVNGGYVKAVRVDLNTLQVLTLDSASINPTDGSYILDRVRSDSVDVIAFPNDIIENDFIPTYYPETIEWENAIRIYLTSNLSDVDIKVIGAQGGDFSGTGTIKGNVTLNFLPFGLLNGDGLSFKSGAVVYAQSETVFRNFAISNNFESYEITSLPAGNYNIIVNRFGYSSDTMNVNLSPGGTIDNINFTLVPVDISVGISPVSSEIPDGFALHQNYPNPFNPVTNIGLEIKQNSSVNLVVYDVTGRVVRELLGNHMLPAGTYNYGFDGSGLASGLYFYRLEVVTVDGSSNNFVMTKKMILLK